MPRPALTRSRIVAAGVGIAGELGFSALSTQAVARRVGSTATGVQRHIGSTELVDCVVAEVLRSMPPVPSRGDWSRRLRQWAVHTRTWLAEYPGLARHLLLNRWEAVAALDRLEEVVGVLGDTDLSPAQRMMAGTTLYWFVLSRSDLDEAARIIGGDPRVGDAIESPERWPLLSAHISDRSVATAQAQFVFGLGLILEGIATRRAKGAGRSNDGVGGSAASPEPPSVRGT